MDSSSAAAPALSGLRRLSGVTLAATFALIVLGGVVRVSDSGLGCGPEASGFHGWPLCRGDVIPSVALSAYVEYSHRALASIVGILMLAMAVLAWRRRRGPGTPRLAWAAVVAAGLVIAQGLLGAATVEKGLDAALVAAHLALSMLLLALVMYVSRSSRPGVIGSAPPDGGPGLRALAVASQAVIFATIVAGGYMAGTQHYGRPDYQLGAGAHHACGREFPTCNGELLPFGQAPLVDVHLTHRVLMYIASALVLALVIVALRRRPSESLARTAKVALGLLVAQILVGALNVWLEESELLILAHLTLATLLWAALVGLGLQLHRVPAPQPGKSAPPSRSATEAATA